MSQNPGSKAEPDPSQRYEEVQKIAETKEWLQAKISELEQELARLRDLQVLVDSKLREKSFVTAFELTKGGSSEALTRTKTIEENSTLTRKAEASHAENAVKTSVSTPGAETRQLRRTKDSMLLANVFIDNEKIVIVPIQEVRLSQHTPPFETFLVNRILRGFQAKDEDDLKNGKLNKAQILQFSVQQADGNISNITITNYRDATRLNEILSTATWAFTRMLEKK